MRLQLTVPNERLFLQGEYGDKIFILVNGETQILIRKTVETKKNFTLKNSKNQKKRGNLGLELDSLNLVAN